MFTMYSSVLMANEVLCFILRPCWSFFLRMESKNVIESARKRYRGSSRSCSSPTQMSIPFSHTSCQTPPTPPPDQLKVFLEMINARYSRQELMVVKDSLFLLVQATHRYDLIEIINSLDINDSTSKPQMIVNSNSTSFLDMHHNDSCNVSR